MILQRPARAKLMTWTGHAVWPVDDGHLLWIMAAAVADICAAAPRTHTSVSGLIKPYTQPITVDIR